MNMNSPSLAQLQTVGVCEIFQVIPPQVCAFLLWRWLDCPGGGGALVLGDLKQGLDFLLGCIAGDGTHTLFLWCFLGGTSPG